MSSPAHEASREKWRLERERAAAERQRLRTWSSEVYGLPPADRPYGQRGKYPKPPIYPKAADGSTFCRWCAKITRGRRWCADGCVAEFMRRGHWPTMAAYITKRDLVCRLCGDTRYDITRARWYWPAEDSWPNDRSGFKSEACRLKITHAVDHIVAVKDGGTDDPANLRLLCGRCHSDVGRLQHARWSAERRAAKVASSGQGALEI